MSQVIRTAKALFGYGIPGTILTFFAYRLCTSLVTSLALMAGGIVVVTWTIWSQYVTKKKLALAARIYASAKEVLGDRRSSQVELTSPTAGSVVCISVARENYALVVRQKILGAWSGVERVFSIDESGSLTVYSSDKTTWSNYQWCVRLRNLNEALQQLSINVSEPVTSRV